MENHFICTSCYLSMPEKVIKNEYTAAHPQACFESDIYIAIETFFRNCLASCSAEAIDGIIRHGKFNTDIITQNLADYFNTADFFSNISIGFKSLLSLFTPIPNKHKYWENQFLNTLFGHISFGARFISRIESPEYMDTYEVYIETVQFSDEALTMFQADLHEMSSIFSQEELDAFTWLCQEFISMVKNSKIIINVFNVIHQVLPENSDHYVQFRFIKGWTSLTNIDNHPIYLHDVSY